MASITLTLPDAQALRLFTDLATVRGVDPATMPLLSQKVAFLKTDLVAYWNGIEQQAELPAVAAAAATTATNTRIADISANLQVT